MGYDLLYLYFMMLVMVDHFIMKGSSILYSLIR